MVASGFKIQSATKLARSFALIQAVGGQLEGGVGGQLEGVSNNPAFSGQVGLSVRSAANPPWACSKCTFKNAGAMSQCQMCGVSKDTRQQQTDNSQIKDVAKGWNCSRCSFLNDDSRSLCDICQFQPQGPKSTGQQTQDFDRAHYQDRLDCLVVDFQRECIKNQAQKRKKQAQIEKLMGQQRVLKREISDSEYGTRSSLHSKYGVFIKGCRDEIKGVERDKNFAGLINCYRRVVPRLQLTNTEVMQKSLASSSLNNKDASEDDNHLEDLADEHEDDQKISVKGLSPKVIVLDFDKTISSKHVFLNLSRRNANTETGQIKQLLLEQIETENENIFVKHIGGQERVERLDRLFKTLTELGNVTLAVHSRGYIGVIMLILKETGLLKYFAYETGSRRHHVYGNVDNYHSRRRSRYVGSNRHIIKKEIGHLIDRLQRQDKLKFKSTKDDFDYYVRKLECGRNYMQQDYQKQGHSEPQKYQTGKNIYASLPGQESDKWKQSVCLVDDSIGEISDCKSPIQSGMETFHVHRPTWKLKDPRNRYCSTSCLQIQPNDGSDNFNALDRKIITWQRPKFFDDAALNLSHNIGSGKTQFDHGVKSDDNYSSQNPRSRPQSKSPRSKPQSNSPRSRTSSSYKDGPSIQYKKTVQKKKYTWTCSQCTFENSELLSKCEMCRAPKPSKATLLGNGDDQKISDDTALKPSDNIDSGKTQFDHDNYSSQNPRSRPQSNSPRSSSSKSPRSRTSSWACPRCTFLNPNGKRNCGMCSRQNSGRGSIDKGTQSSTIMRHGERLDEHLGEYTAQQLKALWPTILDKPWDTHLYNADEKEGKGDNYVAQEALALKRQGVRLSVVYASPLRRQFQTACILAKEHGQEVRVVNKLGERLNRMASQAKRVRDHVSDQWNQKGDASGWTQADVNKVKQAYNYIEKLNQTWGPDTGFIDTTNIDINRILMSEDDARAIQNQHKVTMIGTNADNDQKWNRNDKTWFDPRDNPVTNRTNNELNRISNLHLGEHIQIVSHGDQVQIQSIKLARNQLQQDGSEGFLKTGSDAWQQLTAGWATIRPTNGKYSFPVCSKNAIISTSARLLGLLDQDLDDLLQYCN